MAVSRDHYYKLASEVPGERIEAATALLSELSAENSNDEWDYALNRLIKGLTSSRQSARYGFSMALTEVVRDLVLRETHGLSISSYLQKVIDASVVASSMKGNEARSLLFGRLFGFQALVNTKLLLDPQASSKETLVHFIRVLVQLSGMKPWLRETAMYTMCQFLPEYLDSAFSDENTTVAFLQSISDEGLVFTTEGLAVYLALPREDLPRLCDKVRSSSQWKNGDPLTKGNLPTLAKVLKDAEVLEKIEDEEKEEKALTKEEKKAKNNKTKSAWSPKIPFVWDYLFAHFTAVAEEDGDVVETESSKKRKKSSTLPKKRSKSNAVELIAFRDFWKVVVDDTMFSEKASAERNYWGLDIFTKFLQKLPVSFMPNLLTPNLLRCLATNSVQNSRPLNKYAKKILDNITQMCLSDHSKLVPCLGAIIDERGGGYWNFDACSKSKTLDTLIAVSNQGSVDEELVAEIYGVLHQRFKSAVKSQKAMITDESVAQKNSNDSILRWVFDKMLLLFRSTKKLETPPIKVMEDFVKFLLTQAFFKSSKGNAVSQSIQKMAKDKLDIFLADFISLKRKDHSWAYYCVKQMEKLEKKGDLELILDISGELAVIKSDTLETLEEIKKAMKDDRARNQRYCFELLISMVLLQLYVGETETVSVLEDLKVSYNSVFGDEDVDSGVIITEVILSFVSRKSGLLKKLSTVVWEAFMCQKSDGVLNVNEACFKRLFDILATKENEEGQKNLFDGEEEFGEEDDDEDEEDEEEEEEKGKEKEKISDVEAVERETNIKLANALGINHDGEVKFDEIDSFGEDDDYESESMDDEQMMAIDEELSRIFKERHTALSANNTRKKNSVEALAKEQMILFKNRILDLLESFCRIQPHSSLNLTFIRPIVNLINQTKDKNVGVKAHKLLKTRVSKVMLNEAELAHICPSEEELKAYCASLLDEIKWLQHQASTLSRNSAHGAACAQSCILLSKNLVSINKEYLPQIIAIYSEAMMQWATNRKNRLQPSVFFDFINWLNDKR